MKASNELIEAIKRFEGVKLTAYKCPAGVWTIGVGHTKGVRQGQKITEAQALQLLREDLETFENYVCSLGLHVNQNQFDALVDFAFNCGVGNLRGSTLLKKIKAKSTNEEIQKEFRKWVYGGGKVLPGLVTRRNWEAEMWVK